MKNYKSWRASSLQAFKNLVIDGATTLSDNEILALKESGKVALSSMPKSIQTAVFGSLSVSGVVEAGMQLDTDDFLFLNRLCLAASSLPPLPHCILFRGETRSRRRYQLPNIGDPVHFPFPFSATTDPEVAISFASSRVRDNGPYASVCIVYVLVVPAGYKAVFDPFTSFLATGMGSYREFRPLPCVAQVFRVDKDVTLPSSMDMRGSSEKNLAGHTGSIIYCNIKFTDLHVLWTPNQTPVVTALPLGSAVLQSYFKNEPTSVLPMMKDGKYVFNPEQRPATFMWKDDHRNWIEKWSINKRWPGSVENYSIPARPPALGRGPSGIMNALHAAVNNLPSPAISRTSSAAQTLLLDSINGSATPLVTPVAEPMVTVAVQDQPPELNQRRTNILQELAGLHSRMEGLQYFSPLNKAAEADLKNRIKAATAKLQALGT